MGIDHNLNRLLSRRQFMAGVAGATASLGAASFLNTPLAAALGRRTASGAKSEPILMWGAFQEIQQEAFFKQQYLNPWNNSHPNMAINLVVKPLNSFAQLQQTAIEAGAGPAVVQEDGSSTVVPLAAAKQILPLDDYAKQYGWKELILPWAFEASTYEGKLWSLPNAYETMVVYHNPATFEKYGWKPPTTLDETEGLMKEALGKGLQPITAGKADWAGVNEWFVTMMWNHYSGPDALYQALSGQIKWTDPVFVEPMALLQKWFKAGYIGRSSQDYFTTHFATAYNNLVTGKGVMYWSGTWEFSNLSLYFGKAGNNDATLDLGQCPPDAPGGADGPQRALNWRDVLHQRQGEVPGRCRRIPGVVLRQQKVGHPGPQRVRQRAAAPATDGERLRPGHQLQLRTRLRRTGRQLEGGQHRLHDVDFLATKVGHVHNQLV